MSDTAPRFPDTLFYYTDAAGLQGILNPSRWPIEYGLPETEEASRYRGNADAFYYGRAAHLMATDVRYMNDASELKFGAEVVCRRLAEARDTVGLAPELREAFARSVATFRGDMLHKWPWQSFAACFCANGDLLSQWRGYAGGTGGYAIGFSTEALQRHANFIQLAGRGMIMDMPFPTRLRQVAYGSEAADKRADDLIRDLIGMWDNGDLLRDSDGKPSMSVGTIIFDEIAHPQT